MQLLLFEDKKSHRVEPFRTQLLKWVGNKQRFANQIISYFPETFGNYIEPFLGSGALLGTLSPQKAFASDICKPLVEIWRTLKISPQRVKQWYAERWQALMDGDKTEIFNRIKAAYNSNPNGADLLFLSRSCYGGVVRFRQADGYISTPCGIHNPIPPASFSKRVDEWHRRVKGATFAHVGFQEAMAMAKEGDLIYCDPPYSYSQAILYGGQSFKLNDLFLATDACKSRGVYVALSIDGTKRSGSQICDLRIPEGLFEREVIVNCGRSMLKRFQMNGKSLEGEVVADRLLLTY